MPSQGEWSQTEEDLTVFAAQLLPKKPEERAENEPAPPLTSHNRPGKRFAATLDCSSQAKPNKRQGTYTHMMRFRAHLNAFCGRPNFLFPAPHYRLVIFAAPFVHCAS